MNFITPWAFGAAVAVAAAVTALHFLTRDRPRATLFPTSRFIPAASATAPAWSLRARDLVLLALRVAVVLLLGAAVASPTWKTRNAMIRIVMLDRSRAVANPAEAATRARSALRAGDLLVAFGAEAEIADRSVLDALAPLSSRGSLSAALVVALRAARAHASEVQLSLISPLASEEWDQATSSVRALWRAPITVLPVALATITKPAVALAGGDDPLIAALDLLGRHASSESAATVRIRRSGLTAGDSTWSASGGTLVWWPANPPAPWVHATDSSHAVMGGGAVVVSEFPRVIPSAGVPVARWENGEPAATERTIGHGCERDVGIVIPVAGDVVLRTGMLALISMLTAPCGMPVPLAALADSLRRVMQGSSTRPAGAAIGSMAATVDVRWLLVVALILLLAEPLVRARTKTP